MGFNLEPRYFLLQYFSVDYPQSLVYENNLIKEEETMKKNIHLFVSIFVMSFAEGRAKNRRIAIILLPQE
jgi:hypothetical protein